MRAYQDTFDFGYGGWKADETKRQQRAADEVARKAREREEKQRAKAEYERQKQRRTYSYTAPESAWDILGLSCGSSQAEIRSAWIRLIKQYHPDVGGDAAMFRKVQAAYESLRRM